MKNNSKLLCIAVLMICVFIFKVTDVAYAGDKATIVAPDSDEILYCFRGQDAPAKLLEELNALAVHVDENTLLKVVRMQTSTRCTESAMTSATNPTVLMVTNTNGRNVTTDVFLAIGSDGNFISVMPEDGVPATPRAGGSAYLPPDGSNLVRATAVYNKVYKSSDIYHFFPYYQPVGVYFIYYSDGVSVLSIASVCYLASGFEYTYPGFVEISNNIHDHTIVKYVSNPASNTYYNAVNEYSTDRALHVTSGAPDVGQYFVYTFRIDGNFISGTVRIFDN